MTMTPSEALRYMDGLDFIDDKAKARHNEAVEVLEASVNFTQAARDVFGPTITVEAMQQRLEAMSMKVGMLRASLAAYDEGKPASADVQLLEARAMDDLRCQLLMHYMDAAKTIPIKSPEGADAGHANAARVTVAMQFTEQALAVISKRWGQ